MFGKVWQAAACVALLAAGATEANAGTVTVNAADNIYGAGQASAPGGGNVPGFISLSSNAASISFSSVIGSMSCGAANGCITINGGGNLNNADGIGAAPGTSSNTGSGSISGIVAPGAGYLVGLFVGPGGPSGAAPALLDFTSIGTNFASLSPLLDQTFFIGDGQTGDDTGTEQTFVVPTGATELFLGISDACSYNGNPGCIGDNDGQFTATYTITGSSPTGAPTGVPEPATLAMLGTGIVAFGLRRRYTA